MHFLDGLWTTTTYVVSLLTLSPVNKPDIGDQAPLLGSHSNRPQYQDIVHDEAKRGPIFKPPSGRLEGPGSDFQCDYSSMVGWSACSTPDDRGCWLKKGNSNNPEDRFDIHTNYEDHAPKGTTRHYSLYLTDDILNADGMLFDQAKLFNGHYPGPWIQACWGDQVVVEVHNNLKLNGTSLHWHGIRQLNTSHMDGVNGVTQCPIAPGETFTYNWTALQYGTSWYHSHYSVQYADGALGPLTLHGPTSANFDEAKLPILMTDWGHNSAFESIWTDLEAPSILLNGIGNVTRYNNSNINTVPVPEPYRLKVEPPGQKAKRYLLRIINTSFDTTFVFSIDMHEMLVVEADFVPIKPYKATNILVGIGQRYHVIITASDPAGGHSNYFMRTYSAHCFGFPRSKSDDYEKTGILSYLDQPRSKYNVIVDKPYTVDLNCSDEDVKNLQPVVPWPKIGYPVNDPKGHIGENFTIQFQYAPDIFPLAVASMVDGAFDPMQVNYADPIFLHLNYTGGWNPLWVVYPENYNSESWVWMVLKGPQSMNNTSGVNAHPMHLHGHDFAILQQNYVDHFPEGLNLNLEDPPRRDVVLLPDAGYVVIAFQTDNPGTWIFHCHIAFHASFGLGMQIIERQHDAAEMWPSLTSSPALESVQQTCNSWNKWWGDCRNWWPGDGSSCALGASQFGPDSGFK